MSRYICVHAHFYQPPRENPWLEFVELQTSAHPYHDWNQRITSECYAPNLAARILGPENTIAKIVNNYKKISFNFGPTLLSWMEKHEPQTYQGLLAADREAGQLSSGHGPALAQCYNHMIMPLANSRDKRTQILWGLRDFEYRFGRKAIGMWLPEAAVDTESLELLAESGVRFTILAPNQCRRVREIGKRRWQDSREGSVDPRVPYLCRLPSGKSMVVFFYDGPISRDIAFGDLLNNGENLAHRLLSVLKNQDSPQLAHIATDGETYGHHHKMGDMALAYALDYIARQQLGEVIFYSEFLEKFPPIHEAEIYENSSWSCAHGVERWRENCGCQCGGQAGWTQTWRAPLRRALDWLRDEGSSIYEREGEKLLRDVWAARDDYIEVILDRNPQNIEKFFDHHALQRLNEDEKVKVLKLLEMQRQAMLMYTSCGWFFSEISGIETTQILQYASRAIQLAEDLSGQRLENQFLHFLMQAPSNILEFKNGREVYEKFIRPLILALPDVAAHYAISSAFLDYEDSTSLYCYTATRQKLETHVRGDQKLLIGKVLVRSEVTWEKQCFSFVVLHFGGHNLLCGVELFKNEKLFNKMQQAINRAFHQRGAVGAQRRAEEYFHNLSYTLRHLFGDEQRKVLYQILDKNFEEIENSLREINKHRIPIINATKQLNMTIPKILSHTVSVMYNSDLLHSLGQTPPDIKSLKAMVQEVKEYGLDIDRETIELLARRKIEEQMLKFDSHRHDVKSLKAVEDLLEVLRPLKLNLDLWRPQNIYFEAGQALYHKMKNLVDQGDNQANEWLSVFDRLGHHFRVSPAVFMQLGAQ